MEALKKISYNLWKNEATFWKCLYRDNRVGWWRPTKNLFCLVLEKNIVINFKIMYQPNRLKFCFFKVIKIDSKWNEVLYKKNSNTIWKPFSRIAFTFFHIFSLQLQNWNVLCILSCVCCFAGSSVVYLAKEQTVYPKS